MAENLFSYDGDRGELVEIFYDLLVAGKEVSYEDILTDWDGGTLSVPKITAHPLYKTLKHVVPEVVKTLRKYDYSVLEIPYGRSTCYQYVGSDKDPLRNIRLKAQINIKYNEIADYIKDKKAFKITYKPFDRKTMDIIFHPHLLYTYNGRHFAFGVSVREEKEPLRKFCIALDRIKGDIRGAGSATIYMPSRPDEYSYLSNIVGVRLEEGETLCTIKIRAMEKYTFGRLNTKPLHDSQKVVLYPDWKEGREYGEFEITVIPNVELIGQILSYGSTLQILSPENVRIRIMYELNNMINQYKMVQFHKNL